MRRNIKQSRRKGSAGMRGKTSAADDEYKLGMADGYREGIKAGFDNYSVCFEGTSIIIPCRNDLEYVRRCINSISEHTEAPYEIILVDNASADGTRQYLKELNGQVRYCLLDENAGYLMSANRGLMMAKGTTLLLMNNRLIATDYWLENMLGALYGEEGVGMVGPVSGAWLGDQGKILAFDNLDCMQEQARRNNESDPLKRRKTDKLSIDCLLFRRELLGSTGYLDEAFEDRAYGELDYSLRVRLQNYSLVCAGDVYVQFDGQGGVTAAEEAGGPKERSFIRFMEKWTKADKIVFKYIDNADRSQEELQLIVRLGEAAYYPYAAAVEGLSNTVYWIDNEQRQPVTGRWESGTARLTQLDLKRWAPGAALTAKEAACRQKSEIIRSKDGVLYLIENGKKREVLSRAAEEAWLLALRPYATMSEAQLAHMPRGLPIIAPARMRQPL